MLEDNPVLAKLVSLYLSKHFRVDVVGSLGEARDFLAQFNYDVVLLDRNLNGADVGLNFIADIKQKNHATGIIVISSYDSITDKIEGLNLGADDYLDKPFDNDELLARIYALSRRNQPLPQVQIEGLVFDMSQQVVKQGEESINLTKKESDLLFYLVKKQGQIVSKDELLDALYINPQNISSNTIDVTIAHVRKKLPQKIVKTIKTRGYIIE